MNHPGAAPGRGIQCNHLTTHSSWLLSKPFFDKVVGLHNFANDPEYEAIMTDDAKMTKISPRLQYD